MQNEDLELTTHGYESLSPDKIIEMETIEKDEFHQKWIHQKTFTVDSPYKCLNNC
jgi:hypothetical protein